MARMTKRMCKVPGCGRLLWNSNKTGVCRDHNHAKGWCACAQCTDTGTGPWGLQLRTREELMAIPLSTGRMPVKHNPEHAAYNITMEYTDDQRRRSVQTLERYRAAQACKLERQQRKPDAGPSEEEGV